MNVFHNSWSMAVVALGAALGYGNFMDFPFVVGTNGGSAFLLVFFLCQLVIAVPVMLSEFLLGRRSHSDVVQGWGQLSVGRPFSQGWKRLGWVMSFAGLVAVASYSVLFAWSSSYLEQSLKIPLVDAADYSRQFFDVVNDYQSLLDFQVIFFALLALFVMISSFRGLATIMMVFVPLTLLSYVALLWVSFTESSFWAVMVSVFSWQPEALSLDSLLHAMNQAFFSLGIGMGALWFCGANADKRVSIGTAALLVLLFDLLASITIALAFGFLNISGSELEAGSNILFQLVPMHLEQSSHWIFYLSLVLTGITSALLVFEALVLTATNSLRVPKWLAVVIISLLGFSLGLIGQLSFNYADRLLWYGRTIFDNYTMLSSGLLVPLSGALVAVFVGWVMRSSDAKDEWQPSLEWRFWLWRWSLRVISILAILLVFFIALEQHLGLSRNNVMWVMVASVMLVMSTRRFELERQ